MEKRATNAVNPRVQALLKRYAKSWDAWQETVAGLRDADYLTPNISKQWNVKDVLGHLAAYMNLMARHLRTYNKRKRLASPRAPSYSYFNRREAARRKNVPIVEVRAELESGYTELMKLLAELKDDDLKKEFPSQWWNSPGKVTLNGYLREEANHIQFHVDEVRKWREKNGL